jgi:TM2 domain-containing membrane protein YozV
VIKHFIFISILFIAFFPLQLKANNSKHIVLSVDSVYALINATEQESFDLKSETSRKLKLIGILRNATAENKKVTAAIFALTLGMLGVHRIYLGTAPYIPAVYLFTFGGGFFILPLIDLVMILSAKDIGKFENNNRLLMWAND